MDKKPIKKHGLGRGLEALLSPTRTHLNDLLPQQSHIEQIPLSQIIVGLYQMRVDTHSASLQELAHSIEVHGVLQPILVRLRADLIDSSAPTPKYEIIAGERRFRASELLALDTIPAIVYQSSDQEVAIYGLIENLQREDLNPIEEAQGFDRLIQEFALTHDEIGQALGRSRAFITNSLRLLKLAPEVRKWLVDKQLDVGHVRPLIGFEAEQQCLLAQEILAKHLTTQEVEKWVQRIKTQATQDTEPPPKIQAKNWQRESEELSQILSTSVSIKSKLKSKQKAFPDEKGEIKISYASINELQAILSKLRQVKVDSGETP